MSKERELLRLLRRVKVLLECSNVEPLQRHSDLIVGEIKELLAQPEQDQEPVAWMNDSGGCFLSDGNKYSENWIALYTEPPKQPESTAEAIMPNGVCVSNVYAAYEEGRKSAMAGQESLTNEQKSAEAALEQALRDSIDTEKLMQILKDGGILIEVGEQK